MGMVPKNRRILVVDDNESIQNDFKEILIHTDDRSELDVLEAELFSSVSLSVTGADTKTPRYEIESAFQGQEGIDKVAVAVKNHTPFAMAFVDIRMPPGMDGVKTARRLWEIDPDIQVVLCSAYSDYSWEEISGQLGRKDNLLILKKPFENIEVRQLASAMTEKWNVLKEREEKLRELEVEVARRKQSEAALRKSEVLFQAILDNAGVAIYIKDLKGRLVLANRLLEKSFHLSIEQLLGKSDYDLFPGETADKLRANDLKILGTEQSMQFEEEILQADGYHTYVSIKFPMFDADGVACGIGGISSDITERKKLEEELRQTKNYLDNIINSMPSVLIGVDDQARVTHWNLEAQKVTGISEDKARGQMLEKVFPQIKDQAEMLHRSLRERAPSKMEKVLHTSEGHHGYSDIMIYPLIDNGLTGAVLRMDNVTTRVQLEDMMIQSEKMMSVGGLAAGMAHEINNPLAGIIQNIQVMKRRFAADLPKNIQMAEECGTTLETIQDYLNRREIFQMIEMIRDSGMRAAGIVKNMLSFSRKSESSFELCDIGELLDKTVELANNDYDLKKRYDFRKIEIIREYHLPIEQVFCEGSKIQQVFLNLLRNGAQAMAEQGDSDKSPCFVFRIQPDCDMINIEIEDNGPGMTEDVRKRVFEPFFTTKGAGDGTGLGLSVSYFIVTKNHGGTMAIESAPGRGTTFVIRLPFKREQGV